MNESFITGLYNRRILTYTDTHFGSFITKLTKNEDPDIFLAAALVSNAAGNGDVCLDLGSFAGKEISEGDENNKPLSCPPLDIWVEKLEKTDIVGKPGDYRPLVLDSKNRLYLYRYWNYEKRISDSIKLRAAGVIKGVNIGLLRKSLEKLFSDNQYEDLDLQKIAALTAVYKRFCVVSGGPGTGKTTTIAKILALLAEIEPEKKLKTYLCAPTGKAAAKLGEAIQNTKKGIDCSEEKKRLIPEDASTIHRMLKTVPGSARFYYNAENKLPADVVVVDEASMVDLALLSKLLDAVPEGARIILVGDKDQLASVEAGSVLGDICNRGGIEADYVEVDRNPAGLSGLPDRYSIPGRNPLNDCIVVLQKNYRFPDKSGIGRLSGAVNKGDYETAFEILRESRDESIRWKPVKTAGELYCALGKKIIEGYTAYHAIDDPVEALESFGRFKILCAINNGLTGVDGLNRFAETVLAKKGLISPVSQWYRGRPILIKGNNYSLGLFNGDTGIIMAERNSEDNLYAFFHSDSRDARKFKPGILPEHDTAYAMTVHKSQGSEYAEVVVVLPEKDSPVLSRELIYTGLTRTTGKITLFGTESVLKEAISRKTERASGLRDALWGE
jgi:exodeoxyribonuclease V alpha subunit